MFGSSISRLYDLKDDTTGGPIDFNQVIENKLRSQQAENKGSHTEYDPQVFYPSSVGYSKWIMTGKKLGIEKINTDSLRIFEMGNILHEFIQNTLASRISNIGIESHVELSEDDLTSVGHADSFDTDADVIYDIKTRNS